MRRMDLDQRLEELAPLAEPARRALYLHVAGQPEPVGRDAAAAAVGVTRALAAFHLDRLVDAGLLATEYRRLTGRSGPGAGRPAKLYRRAQREIQVSLPERRYELVARLLASAIDAPATSGGRGAVDRAARQYGEAMGREARRRAGPRPSRARLRSAGWALLAEHGFEPIAGGPVGGPIMLRNCPFDALARDHRDLVCGMNLSLMEGVLDGLRLGGIEARLDTRPGMCCVVWSPSG
jgi:predicted ArsR family transcriptional regulator